MKIIHEITVPDFTASPLMMSGISLTSHAAAAVPTFQPLDLRASGLPGPASASRDYARDDTLVVYAELYENVQWTDSDAPLLHVSVELRTTGGRIVATQTVTRSSGTPRVADSGHPFAIQLPLRDVPRAPTPYAWKGGPGLEMTRRA